VCVLAVPAFVDVVAAGACATLSVKIAAEVSVIQLCDDISVDVKLPDKGLMNGPVTDMSCTMISMGSLPSPESIACKYLSPLWSMSFPPWRPFASENFGCT